MTDPACKLCGSIYFHKAPRDCLSPARGSVITPGHPEEFCDDCGGFNVVWFSPSPLWNKIVRQPQPEKGDPMLCPRCFILRCEKAGIHFAWQVAPESPTVGSADSSPPPEKITLKSIDYVTLDFARGLERELDEAKADCNRAGDFTEQLKDALRRAMNTTPSGLTDWKSDMRREFVWLREP